MNTVLFSEDRFGAEVLLEILKNDIVSFVVCPYFENNIYKRLEVVCKSEGIDFYRTKNINDEYVRNKVTNGNFDLLTSCHCSRIIAKEIFSLPKYIIPTAYIYMKELLRCETGKIDKTLLKKRINEKM